MNKDDAEKYLNGALFQEWLPEIHSAAKNFHYKYENSGRIKSPSDLYEAGMMGLISAFVNWDEKQAAANNNSFTTYAKNCIKGHMHDHVTGIHSHGKEGVIDPHLESQGREFKRLEARNVPPAAPQQTMDEPPPIPKEALEQPAPTPIKPKI